MNLRVLILLPALLLACSPASQAQNSSEPSDDPSAIKVKITRYTDGSYAAMRTDAEGRAAEESTYNAAGRLVRTTVYEFDDTGQAVGALVYSPKGKDTHGVLVYKIRYKYDTMNRIGEVYNFSSADKLISRQVYHYDSTGKVLKIETFDPSGSLINSSSTSPGTPDKKRGAFQYQ